MTFTLVDVVLLVIFFAFVFGGFAMGLIRGVGAIIGLALSTWLAGHYFMPVAGWLTPILGGNAGWANVLAFIIIFLIVNRLVAFLFGLLNHAFDLVSIIPFLKTFNRLGGAILGAAEGILTLGVIIFIIAKFLPSSGLVAWLDASQAAHWLVSIASFLLKLLPQAFDNIKSVF